MTDQIKIVLDEIAADEEHRIPPMTELRLQWESRKMSWFISYNGKVYFGAGEVDNILPGEAIAAILHKLESYRTRNHKGESK